MIGLSDMPLPPRTTAQMPQDIRALLIDDSRFDRACIRRMSDAMELPLILDEVGSIEEMDDALSQADYDLVLIDYRLPVGDGMVALDHLKNNSRNRDAGKIMITGNEAVDTAVQAMQAGCHDFLSKDRMDADVLRRAMLNAMSTALSRGRSEMPSLLNEQREFIRQGMISAFADHQVQNSVAAILSGRLAQSGGQAADPFDPVTLDALLRGDSDPDDFIFH